MRRYTKTGLRHAGYVREFGEKFVCHKKDRWAGAPFVLEPWQWEGIFLPIYGTVDRRGRRRYTRALIGLPRWEGKSECLSLMLMYHLFVERVSEGEAYVVASNERQARIVFNTVKRMIQANPRLAAACDIYKHEIWVKETGCVFKAMPADADSAQGFHPSFCAVDEVHVHRSHELIEAMQSGMVARESGLLVAITTAGQQRKGVLWEMLHGSEDRVSWGKQEGTYVYWVGAADEDDGTDPKVWRKANPASWITDAMLEQQYAQSAFPVFERYHLNRFPSTGTNRAYSGKLWHACRERAHIDSDLPCVIGLDASWTRDTTALLLDQVGADGFHNVLAWVWRKDEALGYIDHEAVEAKIVELCEDFNVTRIACDPNYFTRSMLKLQNEFGLPIEEFRQSHIKMSAASMMLLDVLKEGRMRHGGNAELTDQVLNAGAQETPYGWRITKVQNDLKIDAAVALVMAAYLAESEALTVSEPRVITA
ncbi:MAG: terminase large subunit [Actinomycetes bacterium]